MFKNKALLPIAVVVFVDLLGFSIMLPILPFYASTFHATPEMIGYLVASYSICQFFAGPILGGLSDRYGRRPLLIYSQLGSFVGFVLLAIANSLPMLFLSRIIDGVSGGNLTIAQAYIADVTTPQERSSALAIIGISFGLGFIIGPALGGLLATHYGYAAPAMLAALFSLSSTSLTTFYLKEHTHTETENARTGLRYYTRALDYLKDPTMRPLYAIFFSFALPFALYVSMFSLFAKMKLHFTVGDVSLFLIFVGVIGTIWQGAVIRPMVRKLGDLASLRIALIAMALGLFGLAFARTGPELVAVALVLSFGTGITRPTISTLITVAAPSERKGGALGVSSSLDSLSRSVAPILGGWLIGGLHPNYIGYVGGGLTAIGALIAFRVNVDSHEVRMGG